MSIPIKIGFGVLLGLLLAGTALAQTQEYTLKQAQDYAVQHNYQARNALIDIVIATKQYRETLAAGLPQAQASLSFSNFINIATYLLPAEFFGGPAGTFMEMKFGTDYNAGYQIQLSQLVYSGSFYVGLKMSKAGENMNKLQLEKVQQDVRQAIASSYILCLVAEKNRELMDETITTMESLVKDTKALFEKGFMQETDADKLSLILSDLKTSRLNAENQIRNAYSLFKFNMGLTIDDQVKLTDNLDILLMATDPEGLLAQTFEPGNNISNKIMEAQATLSKLQLKMAKSEYQPVVSAFLSDARNGMRNTFSYFESHQTWYPTTILGVNIAIPLFSSGKRYYKIQTANLNYQKALNTQRQVKESTELGALTARNNFQVSVETFRNKRDNYDLAKKIYSRDQIRYKAGVASATDLNQTYNSMLQAQGTYLGSIMDLFSRKIELEKMYD
ncbi:MAG: TolC family protein [Bacteroidales bacterium]|nr:TolC family protein [Bacteroidales bacterium]